MITIICNGEVSNVENYLPMYHHFFPQENNTTSINLNFPEVPSNTLCLLGKQPKTKALLLLWNSSICLINYLVKKSHQVVISKTMSSLLQVSDLLNCQKVCEHFSENDFPSKTFGWGKD